MNIRDFFSSGDVYSLKTTNTFEDAARLFRDKKKDAAPVIDEKGIFQGLFTRNHIIEAVSTGSSLKRKVEEVMIKDATCGGPDDEVTGTDYFRHSFHPVIDNGKPVGVITIRDIVNTFYNSFRKEFSICSSVTTFSEDIIIATDMEGRITRFNRAAENFFSLIEEKICGRMLHEITGEPVSINVYRTTLRERPFLVRSYPVKDRGVRIGTVTVYQDLTDLKSIIDELDTARDLNQDLDAIIESTSDGLFICDGKGNVLRINKTYNEMTGLDTSGFIGKNMKELVERGIYSRSSTLLALEKRERISIIQKTRTGKTLLATATPVFNDSGEIVRVVNNNRDITELKNLVKKLEQSQIMTERYRAELESLRFGSFNIVEGMLITSEKMKEFVETIKRLAKVDSTILITGESGTGKELVAAIIHEHSPRKGNAYIKVNCGAIPETLLESELFGYEEGAFTGAKKGGKPGYFEMADGGTLFLDEIGELPFDLQAKFLRVVQSMEVTRLGGQRVRKVDVRIVTATNRDLHTMVLGKTFREDLYYRLNVVPVNIPPLRERHEDIAFLADHFLKQYNDTYNMNRSFAPGIIPALEKYDWPGNVRELKNIIERMVVMSVADTIEIEDLPANVRRNFSYRDDEITVNALMPLKNAVEKVEKNLISLAYKKCGTTREIGEKLGINASTVVRKAAKYGITC